MDKKLAPEELEAQDAGLLPDREALSLINTGGGGMLADGAGLLGGAPVPADSAPAGTTSPTTTGPGADMIDLADRTADAQGHGSDGETVTDEPRNETIVQNDSASAGS
jgi:hypothetical protein